MEHPVVALLENSIDVDTDMIKDAITEEERVDYAERIVHCKSLLEKYKYDLDFNDDDRELVKTLIEVYLEDYYK